jgi:hypothetical protein
MDELDMTSCLFIVETRIFPYTETECGAFKEIRLCVFW